MKRLFPFAFILCLLAGILTACSDSSSQESSPPPCYVQMERNGEVYEEYAVQGQVWLLMENFVSQNDAVQFLQNNGAKIIDSQPKIGYYLVEVKPGTESDFIAKMQACREVNYVYPNVIYESKSAVPYVIDNFAGDHGEKVTQMMEEASEMNVVSRNVAICFLWECDEEYFGDSKVQKYISEFLLEPTNEYADKSVVINLSYGPAFATRDKQLWKELDVTYQQKQNYINNSISDLIGLVKYSQACYTKQSKDFVIVKAAGNEGMKHMENILDGVRLEMTDQEYQFFEEHFLIVSAKDDSFRGDEYPNDVYYGGYHKLFSKVDISDKTLADLDWRGTSFAAPRLAGYIVRAANLFEMPVTEVLKHVRKVTRESLSHVIDYEMIENDIEGRVPVVNYPDNVEVTYMGTNPYLSTDYIYQIPCNESLFVSNAIHEIKLPSGVTIRYQYRYDNHYGETYIESLRHINKTNYNFCGDKSIPPPMTNAEYVNFLGLEPLHYIAFWTKREELGYYPTIRFDYEITAYRMDDTKFWDSYVSQVDDIHHRDIVCEWMGFVPGNMPLVVHFWESNSLNLNLHNSWNHFDPETL